MNDNPAVLEARIRDALSVDGPAVEINAAVTAMIEVMASLLLQVEMEATPRTAGLLVTRVVAKATEAHALALQPVAGHA